RYIIDGQTEEFVGGLATEMVGGNEFTGVLGYAEDVNIGLKVDMALAEFMELELGLKFEAGFGPKMTFHEMHEEFIPKKDTFEGCKEHCTGVVNKLIADHNKLVAKTSVLSGVTERVNAEVSHMSLSTQVLCAAVNEINGAANVVAGELLESVGEATSV